MKLGNKFLAVVIHVAVVGLSLQAFAGREDFNKPSKEIAEATEMDKVAVSRAVAKLVESKRVAARADRDDARRQILSLTAQGESVHARIAPIALASEQRLLAALDARERQQLDALLDRLLDAAKML